MAKLSYVIPYHLGNSLFDTSDSVVNRDNFAYSHFILKELFARKGFDLSTYDLNPIDASKAVIYNDMPNQLPRKEDIKKSYLILFESEVIKPENWDVHNHRFFNKIFTWSDELVDNKKYFKINFSHLIPDGIPKNIDKKLCTLIAGNKRVSHPLELYSERVRAIQWFERYHPEEFDFYGVGWDEASLKNKYLNFLFRKAKLSKILKQNYSSYGGKVKSKQEMLKHYRFAICYENARDIPGYITEKIFDCFFAGCVPVYWGANNITSHIPSECFIDRRNFSTYEDLYDFMVSMSDVDYLNYLYHIETYLRSEKVTPFSADYFAKTIVGTIEKDLGN